MSCDCRINYEQVISYCPLHQAAEELLAALQAVLSCEWGAMSAAAALDQANAAIKQAKGGQP